MEMSTDTPTKNIGNHNICQVLGEPFLFWRNLQSLSVLSTETRIVHVFMIPAERNTAALMSQQAMAQKTSQLMKVTSPLKLFLGLSMRSTMRQHTHYKATRVQVNIHVIGMRQLFGEIRSVITGLKIK